MRAQLAGLMLLVLWQADAPTEPPVARPEAMRYERALTLPAGAGQACAVLDAQIFPHAAPSLKDLRVFPARDISSQGASRREVPYAITLSETASEETQAAHVLNLGTSDKSTGASANISFDLEMPDRPYTEVVLDLAGHDFLATATVSGMHTLGGTPTALGAFTLFDLSAQHLSRDTTLPLQESTFPYLHVALSVSPAPSRGDGAPFVAGAAMVAGAQVPPSREAQTVYTTVAETNSISTVGRESRGVFTIPPRVPVERIAFVLAPGFNGNFSRDVRVSAVSEADTNAKIDPAFNPPRETVTGTILRVHVSEAGREIRTAQFGIPAILGANLQRPARVEVDLENGDDQPLPIAAVLLEMRQRKLCFDAPDGLARGLALYYGDPALAAPVYDYDRLFTPSSKPLLAALWPEQANPSYKPPPAEARPFTERHPEVLWVALIAVVCVLGGVALRSSRNVQNG